MRALDLAHDVLLSISVRPMRTLMTLAGILLGMASLVITSGLAASAGANVVATFDRYQATQVTLTSTRAATWPAVARGVDRLQQLPGVSRAGPIADLSSYSLRVTSVRSVNPMSGVVRAATPAALDTLRPTWLTGGNLTQVAQDRAARVVVLGYGAATELGIGKDTPSPSVTIDGLVFAVVGILADVRRNPEAMNAAFVPVSTAVRYWGDPKQYRVWAETEPGAAATVGQVAARVLAPENVSGWAVDVPPEPAALRSRVTQDLTTLYLALGGMSLMVGALSIGNTMSVSVLERTTQIGLRRALGFTRGEIVGSFAGEATLLGLLGGLLGAAVGVAAVGLIDQVRGWPIVLDPLVLLLCTPIGAVIGFLGGLWPAIRAGSLEPASAVRA